MTELQNGLKDLRDLCIKRAVPYMAERDSKSMRFEELNKKVRLNPNSLCSHADLEKMVADYNLPTDGNVATLCNCLSQHLAAARSGVTEIYYKLTFHFQCLEL